MFGYKFNYTNLYDTTSFISDTTDGNKVLRYQYLYLLRASVSPFYLPILVVKTEIEIKISLEN